MQRSQCERNDVLSRAPSPVPNFSAALSSVRFHLQLLSSAPLSVKLLLQWCQISLCLLWLLLRLYLVLQRSCRRLCLLPPGRGRLPPCHLPTFIVCWFLAGPCCHPSFSSTPPPTCSTPPASVLTTFVRYFACRRCACSGAGWCTARAGELMSTSGRTSAQCEYH